MEALSHKASVDARGNLRVREQSRTLQRRTLGYTPRTLLVRSGGRYRRRRLRLQGRLAVAEHSALPFLARCRVLDRRLRALWLFAMVGAPSVRYGAGSGGHGPRAFGPG